MPLYISLRRASCQAARSALVLRNDNRSVQVCNGQSAGKIIHKLSGKPARYLLAIILILSIALNVIQYDLQYNLGANSLAVSEELQARYNGLYDRYGTLYAQNQTLSGQLQSLSQQYEQLNHVALVPPYVLISNDTINWVFYSLNKSVITWQMPMSTYRQYVSMNKPYETLQLSAVNGKTITTEDMRPYIQPSFFTKFISSLTQGRNATEFVREVDNIKNQIVTYGMQPGVTQYQYPAETLTEGKGTCADTTILMASMLIAGNNLAHYGLNVYVWYVQRNANGTLVSDGSSITQPNHAIVEVKFSDGTEWSIETTRNYLYTYSQSYYGWQYDVTSTNP